MEIDSKQAERVWAVLERRLGADPNWREPTLKALSTGLGPVPFVAVVDGVRTTQVLDGEPPTLRPPFADPLHQAALYQAQVWADQELAALWGTTHDSDYAASYGFHSFPMHISLKNHRTHCLQCGVSAKKWRELASEHRDCEHRPPAPPLGGHVFPMEDVVSWLVGECTNCGLDYAAWRKEGYSPCPLVPLKPTSRERPSSLAEASA